MATFKMKMVRPQKHVMLELTEGLPLTKGKWRRLENESNSRLREENGEWENWVLGSPGGSANIRLYDQSDTKSAILTNYTPGRTDGTGTFILDDFGGEFGGEDFQWFSF